MINPALANQSLGRSLSEDEIAFAAALETVFADGAHDPAAVAAALQVRGIARLDGSREAWTAEVLTALLSNLNATLDQAYSKHGLGV